MRTTPKDRISRHPAFYAASAVVMLSLGCFSLAAHLALGRLTETEQGQSVMEAVFGEARFLLGNRFYQQADVYFHRGLEDEQPDRAFSGGPFAILRNAVEPAMHIHAETATEIREIMPWLELAMRTRPDHAESTLVTAYWLGKRLQRFDLAEAVLLRAQQHIPYAYSVQLEKARLYLYQDRYREALAALNAAIAFWGKTANPENPDDRIDLADALTLRALLLEVENRPQEAIADYRSLLTIAPARPAPVQRLAALDQGKIPQPPAAVQLGLMKKYVEQSAKPAHKASNSGYSSNSDP